MSPFFFDETVEINIQMNLTYIQKKMEFMEYKSLQEFFDDVDLLISNAILYNSDAGNPYRHAAEEMKKRYTKIAKKVLQAIKEKQQQQQQAAFAK